MLFSNVWLGLCLKLDKKCLFTHIVRLTDTSRGADSLVSLVAISHKIISQKFNVVLLPWIYIEKKTKI